MLIMIFTDDDVYDDDDDDYDDDDDDDEDDGGGGAGENDDSNPFHIRISNVRTLFIYDINTYKHENQNGRSIWTHSQMLLVSCK